MNEAANAEASFSPRDKLGALGTGGLESLDDDEGVVDR